MIAVVAESDARAGEPDHFHLPDEVQLIPHGRPSLHLSGSHHLSSSPHQNRPHQVGSFNYAMDKIVFRDEFIPTKEDAVRSILDYAINIFPLAEEEKQVI